MPRHELPEPEGIVLGKLLRDLPPKHGEDPDRVRPWIHCGASEFRCACGSAVRVEPGALPWAWFEVHKGCGSTPTAA